MMKKSWCCGTILIIAAVVSIHCQGVPSDGGTLIDLINDIFTQSPIDETTKMPDITTTTVRTTLTTTTRVSTSTMKDPRNDQGTGDDDDEDEDNANQPNPCKVGECTPHYLCKNGTISTDGAGILDIRFGDEDGEEMSGPNMSPKHPCKNLFDICCSVKSKKPIIPPITKPDGCGYRNPNGVGFQITGQKDNEAQFAEFPWMVAILKESSRQGGKHHHRKNKNRKLHDFKCGGSLFHPSVILTAAHCVDNKTPQQLTVRAGEWDSQTTDEIFPHQDRQVSEIVIHKNYNKETLYNDIALLFLATPFKLAENINTACMPLPNLSFDGKRCFATGWGKDTFGRAGKRSVILKKIDLPIISRKNCKKALRKTRLGSRYELHESFICAGGEIGKDTCKGDGGSPLVCPIPGTVNRFYQAGIVSWGIGCGDASPGIYTNVPLFREWIDKKMRKRGITSTNYYNIN